MANKLIDLTGQHFGRLTVINRAPSLNGATRWNCRCDCGVEKVIRASELRSGSTLSCGCYDREMSSLKNTKHGKYGTRPYRIWRSMKTRCYNPNHSWYKRYGGRGIAVCNEWRDDFMSFYNWAMSNGYQDDLTIDRIDNDKGYSPDNCRWISVKKQQNNRCSNRSITINGITKNVSEWCEYCGLPKSRVKERLRRGWTPEEAFGFKSREKN